MKVETRHLPDPVRTRSLGTEALRQAFLVEDLFTPGAVRLVYTHMERLIVGGAVPLDAPLALEATGETGTPGFLDRREIAAVNVGGPGRIVADGERFDLAPRDVLYAGRGRSLVFESVSAEDPARFYLVSAPAHRDCPTRLLRIAEAKRLDLGAAAGANVRSIFQMVHPAVADSCQLVLGITELAPGSVWNTMPPHVHDRRSEAYLYFDLAEGARVIHLMGEPEETRHLVVADRQAVLSPPWSVHCGAGTGAYAFVWAMAGDNVDYTDQDPVPLTVLK